MTAAILNVAKCAPRFKMGYTVISGLSVGEFSSIFVIRWFVNRDKRKAVPKEEPEDENAVKTKEDKETEETSHLPV